MAEYEEVIASLYGTCAERWMEDGDFWEQMAKEEIGHAQLIKQIAQMVEESPRQFDLGRPFNQVAINTAIAGVKRHIEAIKQGEYSHKKAIIIARDLEQSILESRYIELLKTSNVEYLETIKGIVQDTARHRKTIQLRLEEISSS